MEYRSAELEEALVHVFRIMSPEGTENDARMLLRWRNESADHETAYLRAIAVWSELEGVSVEALRAETAAAGKRRSPGGMHGRRAILAGGLSIAAAAAASLIVRPPFGLWTPLSDELADFHTQAGERRQIALNGGVVCDLNTRTSIDHAVDGRLHRVTLLSGEGVFSARGDTSVAVEAGAASVVCDSGREVNVRYTSTTAVVTCIRGPVTVNSKRETVALETGQNVRWREGKAILARDAGANAMTSWREGYLVFQEDPLRDAIAEVNRYRTVPIVLLNDALAARKVTARIEIARLDEILGYIEKVYGVRARTFPAGFVVLS